MDPYCTYRLLSFQYSHSRELRICQRDLTTFNETILMNTQNYELDCVNCHMPNNNNPRRFVLQARSRRYGNETLIAIDDSITTLTSHLGHTAWHPGNRHIAFTVYKVQQYFHAVGRQFIDVYDNYSRIVIYDVHNKKIIPVPQRDPSFYNSFIYCYNVPEFATGPIRFTEQKLLKAIKSHKTLHVPVSTD